MLFLFLRLLDVCDALCVYCVCVCVCLCVCVMLCVYVCCQIANVFFSFSETTGCVEKERERQDYTCRRTQKTVYKADTGVGDKTKTVMIRDVTPADHPQLSWRRCCDINRTLKHHQLKGTDTCCMLKYPMVIKYIKVACSNVDFQLR